MKSKSKSSSKIEFLEVNCLKLIQLVRSNEVLYRSDNSLYNDKVYREKVWERIYVTLFPKYYSADAKMKEIIGSSIRRRWKTLRDSIAREVKKNPSVENYIRKKESPIIAELEFLIPHIKSAHCARLADELGLRDNHNYSYETQDYEDDDTSTRIDLTDDHEIKPDIKVNAYSEAMDNSVDAPADLYLADALIPAVQMNVPDDVIKESINRELDHHTISSNTNTTISSPIVSSNAVSSQNVLNNWYSEYCAVAQFKEGEFMTSTILCPSPTNEEKTFDDSKSSVQQKKRARLENEESTELQTKILQLLTNLELRESNEQREKDNQDEDRMFLLSLVSDLKQVPPSKKMLVKAEIVTSISRAIQ